MEHRWPIFCLALLGSTAAYASSAPASSVAFHALPALPGSPGSGTFRFERASAPEMGWAGRLGRDVARALAEERDPGSAEVVYYGPPRPECRGLTDKSACPAIPGPSR